jgi:coenzyme F420-0:L-glutamate ligase/coenzyme F420-1:gamma-L-glutamate ligase
MPEEIRLTALRGLPEIREGDALAPLIVAAADQQHERLEDGCVVVVAQKIVSKAEGRVADLTQVQPSALATRFAAEHGKDPRLIELALQQARRVVKMERGVLIVETHHGLVCANGGVDVSNVPGENRATLLPLDPDRSAAELAGQFRALAGSRVAVIISDTFGRCWRDGLVNVAVGVAGFRPLADYRGTPDRHGRALQATVMAIADELAAAAGLLMRKQTGTPAVLIFGAPVELAEGRAAEIIRPPDRDLFR